MSENIKVSVVIPAYNVEKYIKQCLDSVINQTLKDIEIICINDGSKDNTLAILKEFAQKDSRIKLIDKVNEGISVARNQGMELARGEYISFIDSDDWIDENYLENLYNTAKKYDSDVACSSIIRVTGNHKRKKLLYTKEEYSNDKDKKNELTNVPICNYVWNKIYRREKLLKSCVKFPCGRVYEDVIWSIQVIYYMDSVVTVPSASYYYRKNPTSIGSTKSEKNAKDFAISEKEMLAFAKEKDLKLLDGYKYAKRERYRFLGITVLKRFYYYPNIVEYCLLGFIPIYRGKIKEKNK